ncbi:type II toxin-antitoxin system PemK/MazF family toxin [Rickettsia helvetica]|uniref:mRNA-degrading endonuclease n=1 Tax=Rickettsia helvetica TaxID=35789 RepID=A0ABM9NCN2_RICHE|nr:type II toxin-antitoxin system PemK/MazF family toxin [Rickettsia helvetica]MCZ6884083.1 type II toxin-antitoxin system PemK/MazF family toxin [Rickettsia endosymbiont of Ixodes ricinus]MCZ6896548.1 type II toxin-antitoxin system PemK/MazF family toxin [Rickettsia endosymbiont of Ixodes ricinus]
MVAYIPERGDVVWLDFDPQKGNEIKKIRPAIVLSTYKYHLKSNLALFVPITSQIKDYPFEVIINIDSINGAVLCDQIRSMDFKARKAKKILSLNNSLVDEILYKSKLLL